MPKWDNDAVRLYQGNAQGLPLEDESVHCVVTSPPYWGLRDYGLGDDALGQKGKDSKRTRASNGTSTKASKVAGAIECHHLASSPKTSC